MDAVVKTALERAQMTVEIKRLTVQGKGLLVESINCVIPLYSDQLYKEGINCLNRAQSLQEHFERSFPNSLNLVARRA